LGGKQLKYELTDLAELRQTIKGCFPKLKCMHREEGSALRKSLHGILMGILSGLGREDKAAF